MGRRAGPAVPLILSGRPVLPATCPLLPARIAGRARPPPLVTQLQGLSCSPRPLLRFTGNLKCCNSAHPIGPRYIRRDRTSRRLTVSEPPAGVPSGTRPHFSLCSPLRATRNPLCSPLRATCDPLCSPLRAARDPLCSILTRLLLSLLASLEPPAPSTIIVICTSPAVSPTNLRLEPPTSLRLDPPTPPRRCGPGAAHTASRRGVYCGVYDWPSYCGGQNCPVFRQLFGCLRHPGPTLGAGRRLFTSAVGASGSMPAMW